MNMKNVPVLLTNLSSLPNLTLWRTLEEQKRQAEEDEKWLEEQEDLATYNPSEDFDQAQDDSAATTRGDCFDGTMNGKAEGKASPKLSAVSWSVTAVTDAVDRLNNAFNSNMKHDDFISSIREVTSKLRKMFSESTEVLGKIPEEVRKEVEMAEALIGNDMRQMGKIMQQVVDNRNNSVRNLAKIRLVEPRTISWNPLRRLCIPRAGNVCRSTWDAAAAEGAHNNRLESEETKRKEAEVTSSSYDDRPHAENSIIPC
ncbi:unnamed protein product [Heligmosomoides polygyrus]|uniref:Focal_AT domain-containing protein n=1 Tax=Heligmosomoides polygyrus TaxID=6339 RepID=A0A183FY40_HELPZ|nr:unnamed protein product [Heligmosomoides polygyrus]